MVNLNLACSSDIKEGFINIDKWNRNGKIDFVCDLTKTWPFQKDSSDYIYCSHFLEHLNWIEGKQLLKQCFATLKKNGVLRIVIPDYKKIFKKYLENDWDFFRPFFKSLNNSDYYYYKRVYRNPERVKLERINNLPPHWHTSNNSDDRKRVKLRIKKYNHLIDIINYFVYQYGEHKNLYDFESLYFLLTEIGFSEVNKTNMIKYFDSNAPTRINSSLYIEAIK